MKVHHYRYRLMVVGVLLIVGAWQLIRHYAHTDPDLASPDLDAAKARNYYEITAERGLSVELLEGDDLLRVSVIPTWPAGPEAEPLPDQLTFAVGVELTDDAGTVLWSGEPSSITTKTRLIDRQGNRFEPAFADDPTMTLMDPRWLAVPVGRLAPSAAFMRLVLPDSESRLMLARVFRQPRGDDGQLMVDWHGHPFQRQERMAASNIFSSAMIRDSERLALMSQRWVNVPPWGTPGLDFSHKRIFRTPHDTLAELRTTDMYDSNTWISPQRSLAVDLPAGCEVRVVVWPRTDGAVEALDLEAEIITLRADGSRDERPLFKRVPFGSRRDRQEALRFDTAAERTTVVVGAHRGEAQLRIEWRSPTTLSWYPVTIQAPGGVWHGIGPQPLGDGIDPALRGEAVFDIPLTAWADHHWYRFEGRAVQYRGEETPPTEPRQVQAVWFRADGSTGGELAIPITAEADPFAWTGNGTCRAIGGLVRRHLRLPKEAARLRFMADRGVAVRVFSRPTTIPLTVQGLKDDVEQLTEEEPAQAWHLVAPVDPSARRLFIRRTLSVLDEALRLRPTQPPEALGSLLPAAGHQAHDVLWPVLGIDQPGRGFVWNRRTWLHLEPGSAVEAAVSSHGRPHPGSPLLLTMLAGGAPRDLVTRDAVTPWWSTRRADGSAAQLLLGAAGPELFQAPETACYIDAIPVGDPRAASWWRRLRGWQVAPHRAWTCDVNKTDRQPVDLVFSLATINRGVDDEPLRVQFRLQPLAPPADPGAMVSERYSYRFRELILPSDPGLGTAPRLLDDAGLVLGPMVSLPVTLWEDLPPGPYRLSMTSPDGAVVVRGIRRWRSGRQVASGRQLAYDLRGPGKVVLRWRRSDGAEPMAADVPGLRWCSEGGPRPVSQAGSVDAVRASLVGGGEPWETIDITVPTGLHSLTVHATAAAIEADLVEAVETNLGQGRQVLVAEADRPWRVVAPAGSRARRWYLAGADALAWPATEAWLDWRIRRCGTAAELAQPMQLVIGQHDASGGLLDWQVLALPDTTDSTAQIDGVGEQLVAAELTVRLRRQAAAAWCSLHQVGTQGAAAVGGVLCRVRGVIPHQRKVVQPRSITSRLADVKWRDGIADLDRALGDLQPQPARLAAWPINGVSAFVIGPPPFSARGALPTEPPAGVWPQLGPPEYRRVLALPWRPARVLPGDGGRLQVADGVVADRIVSVARPLFRVDPPVPPAAVAEESQPASVMLEPRGHGGRAGILVPAGPELSGPAYGRVTPGVAFSFTVGDDSVMTDLRLLVRQVGDELGAVQVSVSVDGRRWWQEQVPTRQAVLVMPLPPLGVHQILITTAGAAVECWVDGADSEQRMRLIGGWQRDRDPCLRLPVPMQDRGAGDLLVSVFHADPDSLLGRQSLPIRCRLRNAEGTLLVERLVLLALPADPAPGRLDLLDGRQVLPLGAVALPVPARALAEAAELTIALPGGEDLILRIGDRRPLLEEADSYRLQRRLGDADDW